MFEKIHPLYRKDFSDAIEKRDGMSSSNLKYLIFGSSHCDYLLNTSLREGDWYNFCSTSQDFHLSACLASVVCPKATVKAALLDFSIFSPGFLALGVPKEAPRVVFMAHALGCRSILGAPDSPWESEFPNLCKESSSPNVKFGFTKSEGAVFVDGGSDAVGRRVMKHIALFELDRAKVWADLICSIFRENKIPLFLVVPPLRSDFRAVMSPRLTDKQVVSRARYYFPGARVINAMAALQDKYFGDQDHVLPDSPGANELSYRVFDYVEKEVNA